MDLEKRLEMQRNETNCAYKFYWDMQRNWLQEIWIKRGKIWNS